MSSTDGLPGHCGIPSKTAVPVKGSFSLPKTVAPVKRGLSEKYGFATLRNIVQTRKVVRGSMATRPRLANTANRDITSFDEKTFFSIGQEMARWKELKEQQDFETNEEMAKFLLDSWEGRETKNDNVIQVGLATVQDFENYKHRTKRTSDELIRFFLQLDVEPGQNVITVSDSTFKIYESQKDTMGLDDNAMIKHLLNSSFRPESENNGSTILSGLISSVRTAVREELLQLVQMGSFAVTMPTSSHHSNAHHGSNMVHSSLQGKKVLTPPEQVTQTKDEQLPESAKKRPRKSLPQRVIVDVDHMSESDTEDTHSLSVSTVGGEMKQHKCGTAETFPTSSMSSPSATIQGVTAACGVQYNYVINASNNSNMLATQQPGGPQKMISILNPSDIPKSFLLKSIAMSLEQGHQSLEKNVPNNLDQKFKKEMHKGKCFRSGNSYVTRDDSGDLKCPYCDYTSDVIEQFKKHIVIHTGKMHLCTMCNRSYTEEYKLKEHIQVKHEHSVHFRCEMCEKVLTSKGGLKYHVKTAHRSEFAYWCDQCSKGFKQLQFYLEHMNKHNGTSSQYKCTVCLKEFAYLASLSIHRKTCVGKSLINNSFICDMCGESYSGDQELQEHISAEHGDTLWYRCGCGIEFRWRAELDEHKNTCENAFNVPNIDTDGLSNVPIVKLESLQSWSGSKIEQESDAISQNVGNNVDSIQITNVESGEYYVCNLTGEEGLVLSEIGSSIHSCKYCDYKTPKISHLKRHEMTHTGKKHKCYDCPKSFSELSKLRTHQSSKHQGHARYKCDKCSRTFSSKGGIMYHQQTKHNNSYKYRCDTCDKGFNTIQHYLGHKNTHTGIRPFVCDKCNIGFSYPSVLTSHRRVCKGKIEGLNGQLDLYPCKECHEKFAMLSALQQHLQEVHGDVIQDQYICDCGQTFELHALFEHHTSKCNASKSGFHMIAQEENAAKSSKSEMEFKQLSLDKVNAALNQPVFPT